MEHSKFFDQVKRHFEYLLHDNGFTASLESYDPKLFGNCVVKLESDTYLIRITLDRGQVFMDIGLASLPGRLYDLAMVVAFLVPGSRWKYGLPEGNLEYFSRLDWQLEKIVSLFQHFQDQILQENLFKKRRKELEKFIKKNYVDPWIR